MSEGVTPTIEITTRTPFFVQGFNTAIAGRQPEHVTAYSPAHPASAAAAVELTKIEQIVEYLKALTR